MQKQTIKKVSSLALGSSMLLLGMLPAASAFASTAPAVTSVTLTSSVNGTATPGSNVTFTASAAQTGSGTPMYQFWTESPNGTWTATGWSSNNTYTLNNVQAGSYEVVAYAADKGQTVPISSESTYSNQFVNVDTSLTFTTNAKDVAPLSPVTITATAKNFTNVVYQYWIGTPNGNGGYTWVANGDYTPNNTYTFTPSTVGTYKIAVYAKDLNAPQDAQFANAQGANEAVYGGVAGVQLSAQSASVVADGVATDTITATVVDGNGNTVADFNGSATISASTGMTAPSTVTFVNGVGSFTVTASTTSSADTISASGLTSSNGITVPTTPTYTSATVAALSPIVTGLYVSPTTTSVANNQSTADSVTVGLMDQAGNPMPTGTTSTYYLVTVDVSGAGTLAGGASSTSEFVGAGAAASIPVYSEPNVGGTITVSASGQNLGMATSTITAVGVGQANHVAVSETTSALTSTTSYGSFSLKSGTTTTTYTLTLEDANGNPVVAPSAETFYVTDNAATGDAYILTSTTATAIPNVSTSTSAVVTIGASQSTATFTVGNTTTQSSPGTLTITPASGDVVNTTTNATLSGSATAMYDFVTGPAASVTVTGTGSIAEGKSSTYTAQVTDVNGNPVGDNNATVTFTVSGASATFANGATSYTTTLTNAGTASVVVDAGSTSGTYSVTASVTSLASVAASATVTAPANTVAELSASDSLNSGLPTSPITLTGLASDTVTVTEENAIASGTTAYDSLKVTTSNNDVLLNVGGTYYAGSATISGTTTSTDSLSFKLLAGSVGSTTVTISDASNPSVAPITFTVNVDPIAQSALTVAPESGFGNTAGDSATFTLPGASTTTSASYASSASDFTTYNAQTGELTVLTPLVVSATVASGTTTATEEVAVWDNSGTYTYLALDEAPNTGAGAISTTAYVGIGIAGPTGSTVQMSVNNGTYDGNTSSTDYAYIPVATENSSGVWSVAPSQNMLLNTQVSLSATGPTAVYTTLIQQP